MKSARTAPRASHHHGFAFGEGVELGRAVGAFHAGPAGRLDDAEGEHAAAEVPLVHRPVEDRFVHLLQLAEREGAGEQAVGDVGVVELGPQAADGVVDDRVVVEGEGGEGEGVVPLRVPGVGVAQADLVVLDEGEVGDRDGSR